MHIDNGLSQIKWTLVEVVTFIAPISLMLYSHFHKSDYAICFTISGIVLLAHIILLIINPSYLYFNDEGKKIVIRTVSAYPLFRKYREYPFPKSSLASFAIKKSLFGLKKTLCLKINAIDTNTKQPKTINIDNISLSIIKNENIEGIRKALERASIR